MKTKILKFKHKKEMLEVNTIQFETTMELMETVEEPELLKIFNFGSEQLARLTRMGVDPFKRKKTKFKLDASKLDEKTIQMLKEKGAIG